MIDGEHCAVLIDINRSIEKTKSASAFYLIYSRAEMYKCGSSDWTCEHLDWKQLGQLIKGLGEHDDTQGGFVKHIIQQKTQNGQFSWLSRYNFHDLVA